MAIPMFFNGIAYFFRSKTPTNTTGLTSRLYRLFSQPLNAVICYDIYGVLLKKKILSNICWAELFCEDCKMTTTR